MTSPSRLTVIACADAVGFGARAAADEDDAHAALAAAQATLRRVFEAHGGHIVNTWGDGVIAEFGAVGEAVRAAIAFQGEHDARPGALRYRIGINLGDVMHEGDDLFGHGVNVAARLQQAAEPGGIMISEAVHAAVVDRLAVGFESVGRIPGKAHEPTIPAWRLVIGGDNRPRETPPRPDTPRQPPQEQSRQTPDRNAPAGLAAVWARLNRRERRGAVVIGFLAAINLLTDPWDLWFVYPAVAIAAILLLARVGRSRP